MRSIENKLLVLPTAGGMNESMGQRSGAAGLYEVQNGRVRSVGTIQKRCGTTLVTGVTDVPTGTEHCLASGNPTARPTEHPCFVAAQGDRLMAGSSAGDIFTLENLGSGYNKWRFSGCFSTCLPVSARSVIAGNGAFDDLSAAPPFAAATQGGFKCAVAQMAATGMALNIRIVIYDPVGVPIYDTIVGIVGGTLSLNLGPKVIASGESFYVVWILSVDIQVWHFTITNGALSVGPIVTVGALATADDSYWDISSYDSTNWYLVYQSAAAVTTLAKMTGTTVSSTVTWASTKPYLSVWGDSTNAMVWIGMNDDPTNFTTQLRYRRYSAALVLQSSGDITTSLPGGSPPLFGPCYSAVTPTDVMCVFSIMLTTGRIAKYSTFATGLLTAQFAQIPYMLPVSKPDAQQRVWFVTAPGSATDSTSLIRYVLLRLEDASLSLAKTHGSPVELATAQLPNPGVDFRPDLKSYAFGFSEVAETATDMAFAFAIPVALETDTSGAIQPTLQAQLYTYTSASVEPHRQVIPAGSETIITGTPTTISLTSTSAPSGSYGACEIGFIQTPAIIIANQVAGSGIAAGSRAYQAVFQSVDEAGRRHLSGPSAPLEVVTTFETSNSVLVLKQAAGQRAGGVSAITPGNLEPTCLLYRTVDGGENYQLVPVQPTDNGTYFLFIDNVPDTVIENNEFIYTDGGVLPNTLAPSCRFMAAAEDRIWCGGLWDRTLLEASKIRVPGEPIEFTNDATHQVVLPEACTGLAYMDGQVVAFAENAIYLVGGDGPNDQGAGTFLPPRRIAGGIGCIDYRSIWRPTSASYFNRA